MRKMGLWDIVFCFDWITPMLMIGQMAFGGMKPIEILDGGGKRGYEIVRILKDGGVKVGTATIFGGVPEINVDDPVLAGKILAQYGIVTDYMPTPDLGAGWYIEDAPVAPVASQEPPSPVRQINRVLDGMFGGIDQLEV